MKPVLVFVLFVTLTACKGPVNPSSDRHYAESTTLAPSVTVVAQDNQLTDREVLVAFYHATGGPNWGEEISGVNYGPKNWLSDLPLDQWDGVTTDATGAVIGLSIQSSLAGLNGEIPPELGQLAKLEFLLLRQNPGLKGKIPPELGQLETLARLRLDKNALTGTIPSELGQLKNLQGLYLGKNRLTGNIPSELGQLSNLGVLSLPHNRLSGSIPTELTQLHKLKILDLSYNRLTGTVPPGLVQLPVIEWLYLAGNNFTGEIPPEEVERPEPTVEYTHVVSFEGTRIKITNTSGGNRIATNKLMIFHADWNIRAWATEDSTDFIDLSDESWTDYIGDHIRISLNCRNHDEYLEFISDWTNPLGKKLFAYAPNASFRVNDKGHAIYPDYTAFENCEAPYLSISDHTRRFWTRAPGSENDPSAPVDFERNTGGTWDIRGAEINLSNIDFFTAPRLSITYHPVVSDSSQIDREAIWLETIVDERMGFVEQIDKTLPLDAIQEKPIADNHPGLITGGGSGRGHYSSSVFGVGEAVYVPPDPINCNDGLFKALDALWDGYRDGSMTWPHGEGMGMVKLAVAVLSQRVDKTYCHHKAGGVAYLGTPFSALVYLTDRSDLQGQFYRGDVEEYGTLLHEIGHNLGLGHTPTFRNPDISSPARDYPLASGLIDKDGYLLHDIHSQDIYVWDANHTYDFMSYHAPVWVSNYNWNKMLDFIFSERLPPWSARVVAGTRPPLWIHDKDHLH